MVGCFLDDHSFTFHSQAIANVGNTSPHMHAMGCGIGMAGYKRNEWQARIVTESLASRLQVSPDSTINEHRKCLPSLSLRRIYEHAAVQIRESPCKQWNIYPL